MGDPRSPIRRYGLLFSPFLVLLLSCRGSPEEISREGGNPDLLVLAQEIGFEVLPVSQEEQSFLQFTLPRRQGETLRSFVLLREGDRLASVFFVSSRGTQELQTVTTYAFQLFSEQMEHLIDEVVERPGHVPIDVLAFTDPVLSEERFVFALIRDTLYEFHVAPEHEPWVQGLLLELAREEGRETYEERGGSRTNSRTIFGRRAIVFSIFALSPFIGLERT